jgi:hypothetical protein
MAEGLFGLSIPKRMKQRDSSIKFLLRRVIAADGKMDLP